MILLGVLLACVQEPRLDAEVGFSGAAFPDAWTRVSVTLRNDAGTFTGTLRIVVRGRGMESVAYRRPVSLPAPSHQRLAWDIFLTGTEEAVEVDLLDAAGKPVRRMNLNPGFLLWREHHVLDVGAYRDSSPWESLRLNVGSARVIPERFPDSVVPLLGVDVIVFQQPETLSSGQEEALRRWVELGGRLVFSAGPSPAACRQGVWREFCPVDGIEIKLVELKPEKETVQVPLAVGEVRKGNVFLSLGGNPAGVRFHRKRGEVVFLAFAPGQVRAGVVGSPAEFWKSILEEARPRAAIPGLDERKPDPIFENTVTLLGRLVPGKLHLNLVSLGAGALALVVYVALIGPVGCRRLKRKGRLARGWIPFGVFAGAFTAFSFMWGMFSSPRKADVSHLVFADEGFVQAFTAVRAAGGRSYGFESAGAISPVPGFFTAAQGDSDDPPAVEPPARLSMPIPASASRALVSARWAEPGELKVSCRWEDRAAGRVGVRNEGGVSLKDCLLVSKEAVYRVGDVGPGTLRSVVLGEIPSVSFEAWAEESVAKGPSRRPAGSWFFSPDRFATEHPLEMYGFHELYRKAPGPGPRGSFVRKEDRFRLRQRKLDLSPCLERGAFFFVGSCGGDLSGVRAAQDARTESLCLLRVMVGEAEE